MERHRETGALGTYVSGGSEVVTLCNGTSTSTAKSTLCPMGSLKTIDDVVTPGYKTKSSKGLVINNPVHIFTHEATGSVVGSYVKTRKTSCTGTTEKSRVQSGYIPGALDAYAVMHGDLEAAVNRVLPSHVILAGTSAMASMKEPDVMLGVTLLEREQTFRMLRRPQGKLIDLLQRARYQMMSDTKWRKLNRGVPMALGNYVIDRWLMYRYGILPLISDVRGLMKAITAPLETLGTRHTARGSSTGPVDEVSYNSSTEYVTTRSTDVGTATAQLYVRAGILYELKTQISNRYGTTLSDVPATLWESIPFSFVADWAINTGDFIQAMQADSSRRILSSWTTVVQTREHDYIRSFSPKTDSSYNYSDSRVGTSNSITRSKSRRPGVSVGLARKTVQMNWRPTDLNHIADGFSLIAALWQSKR